MFSFHAQDGATYQSNDQSVYFRQQRKETKEQTADRENN